MPEATQFNEMLLYILYHACNTWAICYFCKQHFEITLLKERLFVLSLFTASLLTDIIYMYNPFPYIVLMLLYHIIIIGFVLLFFQADTGRKLLAASVLIAIITMLGNFCESVLCSAALFFLHTAGGIEEPFLADWQCYLIVCIRIAVVILGIYGMSNCLTSVIYGKASQWYLSAAIPLLALIAVIDVANWGITRGIMVISRENMGLYYDQLFSYAETGILTALSAFAAGFWLFGMNKIYLEQQKSGQYQSQITAYKMLEEQYRQSKRLRHDMKNHIIALSGLLESKDYKKMAEYLNAMEHSGNLSGTDMTGSTVVDAILYQKRTYAEQKNILWECDVTIPKACGINEFDLCVLFGNLLDNAIEACERMHRDGNCFINIQSQTVKGCFLLEIKNSADMAGTPGIKHDSEAISGVQHNHTDVPGMLYSRKENPEKHGIGLLNIDDVVRNYNGVMDIEVKDGIFTVSILVPMHNT